MALDTGAGPDISSSEDYIIVSQFRSLCKSQASQAQSPTPQEHSLAHMDPNLPPTVRLNNYFQGLGRLMSISYQEKDNGQAAENRWSVVVKIDGEVMGSCDAPRRSAAREDAASQALHRLGLQ